jgi:hypothetical protein
LRPKGDDESGDERGVGAAFGHAGAHLAFAVGELAEGFVL